MVIEATASARRLTLEDYNALPDEPDCDYEVIDGVLYVTPRARPGHQAIQTALVFELVGYVRPAKLGQVIPDADLIIDGRNTYISPDIMYFSAEKWAQIDPREQIRIAPDLVVEILSPSTARKDIVKKRRQYAAIGVPSYWIVDPEGLGMLELTLGEDSHYTEREIEQSEPFKPALFPDLEIDLTKLFA